ncbi:MAG: hypothetical protein LBT48_03630 [Prevotellaceae bacterium]|nr:hypothetical protein [Prevotellaceae bacterium]
MRKQIDTELSGAQIAIVSVNGRAAYRAFEKLYPHQSKRVVFIPCRLSQLGELLAKCAANGVFAVVLDAKPRFVPVAPTAAVAIAPSVSLRLPYLHKLLQQNSLTSFSALTFQTYLTPAHDLDELRNRYFETLRLGQFRENPVAVEPLLRDADYVWFDLNAVRASDAPQSNEPNGLYAEEACRLAYYIGVSNQTKALFLFGYRPCMCACSRTAKFIGQFLWHLSEASAVKVNEKIVEDNLSEYKEIIVDMGVSGQEMYFIQSLATQRWWMKVCGLKGVKQWIPCLSADYETACRGEVPLRWLWYYQKNNY